MFGFSLKKVFIEKFTGQMLKFSDEYQPCGTPSDEKWSNVMAHAVSEGYSRFEWSHISETGEQLPAEVTIVRINLQQSHVLVSYTRDLREVKAAEAGERKVTERTQLMLDAAPMIIQYWDRDYNCIDCNLTALNFYGYSTKEKYFINLIDGIPEYQPDGRNSWTVWREFLDAVFENGHSNIEFVEWDLKRSPVFLDSKGFCTHYNDELVAITYSTDVTQSKEVQKERQRVLVAEESNRTKTRFLAQMSHEIRTPITAVLGISEIQLQDTSLAPHLEEAFAKIYNSAALLLGIINDILDLSRIEAGKLAVLENEYELASMISNASHLQLVDFADKDIEFSLVADENLPAYLVGDTLRIEQILNNLLSNAFKYTDKGSVELNVKCLRQQSEPLKCGERVILEISVRDTGMGMTPEQVESLSVDYARFHELIDRSIGGSGLGMSIVYNLLQLMGAEMKIESTVGVGTSVTVRIPQEVSRVAVLGKETAKRLRQFKSDVKSIAKRFKVKPEPMPYGKVLVVDDVDANLYVAKGLLAFYKLNVETCTSGDEAIKKVNEGKTYDIIFMDQMMPGISGTEAMKKLRKSGYTKPIIVLTANAIIGQAEKFIAEGFDGFVSKPIQTNHLDTVLIKHIKDKQPPEVIAKAYRHYEKSVGDINDFQQNEHLLNRLRANFIKTKKNAFLEIITAIYEGDTAKAHFLVHKLKGISGLIQEFTLSKLAEDVENLLEGEKNPPEEILSELKNELTRVLKNIGDIKSENTSVATGETITNAIEDLDKMQPLLEQRKGECINLLDNLRQVPEAALFVKLIEKFQFPLALKSINVLRGILETL